VQTTSSENSKLVDSGQMADLSLKGRDLFAALTTVPGVYFGNAYLTGGDTSSGAAALQAKRLDPAIEALVQRVRSGAAAGAEESRFVIGGEAYVRLTLTSAPADALEQLKKAGLAITRQEGNEVTGHIAVAKLEGMSQLPFIVWIAPR